MINKIKHILFDLDHTLWDFAVNSDATMRVVWEKYALANWFESYEEFHRIYDMHNSILWNQYGVGMISKEQLKVARFWRPLEGAGLNDWKLSKEISDFYLDDTTTRLNKVMPGALETLSALKEKGYDMHIVTNGFKEVQYKKTKNSGIGQYINQIFISEEIGFMKPRKEFFDIVLSRINATPQECALVGDSPDNDINGAQEYGIRTFFYNSRNCMAEGMNTETIDSLPDLLKVL